jgi:hypothetical protein
MKSRHVGAGLAVGYDALRDLTALGGIELSAPRADASLRPRGSEAR